MNVEQPVRDEQPDEVTNRPCGCPLDYHMSDCPILTDRFIDNPEYDLLEWDPYNDED